MPSLTTANEQHTHHILLIAIPLLFLLAILVYWPGLGGPFLFDDNVHIVKNPQVHIEDLTPGSLQRAWHSSLATFPSNRPLAQLSFGINHALSGLASPAYKATNLGLHLLNGCLVFLLVLRLARLLQAGEADHHHTSGWLALFVTACWLLHPLNFTPVLYVVQRMVLLSNLFVLAGLLMYVSGRLRLSEQRSSGLWLMLTSLPVALLGVFAKESAVLFPLLALSMELTLLNRLPARARTRLAQLLIIALPLLAGSAYLVTHLQYLDYQGRSFTLLERLLTEARALWFYLQQAFIPMLDRFGLQHDDFAVSRDWLTPLTTLPAVIAVLLLIAWALAARRRYPVASFGVLFFLAAHGLESTIFPLEPVFEHRNYLALMGPLLFLGSLLIGHGRSHRRGVLAGLAIAYLLVFAAITHLRAQEWHSLESYIISEVEHHPESPRANFDAAKMLIRHPSESMDPEAAYRSARYYLEMTRQLDPQHLDSLFGLIVLNLHYDRDPEPQWLAELQEGLRNGVVDATKLTTSQFSFLVRWNLATDTHKLPSDTVIALYESALANPRHNRHGRSGILSALRAYYDLVLKQPEKALPYAREATRVWPQRWHYQKRLVELLIKLGRVDDAEQALQTARRYDPEGVNAADADRLSRLIGATAKDTISE